MFRLVIVTLLLLYVCAPAPVADASSASGPRLLVRFAESATASERAHAIARVHASVDTQIAALGITRIVLPSDADATEAARRIAIDVAVAFAEPDSVARTELVPNDSLWFTDPYTALGQWGWRVAQVDRAWDNARGSSHIVVAVVDTGVDPTHPDLAGALLPGATFIAVRSRGCGEGPDDDNSHGTHVAGIIGAIGNNAIGISGVASGVRILPIKALDCVGTGTTSDIARSIVWATDQGARIVNISLGTTSPSETLRSAVQYATDRNVLVVAAVGNCGLGDGRCISPNVPEFPAAFPGVLAVGATARDDSVAPFSSRGPQVVVTAPGIRTVSTTPRYPTDLSSLGLTSGYGALSGTSQAAAFASGVAALVWSNEPGLSASQVRDRIIATADDLGPPGRDDGYGAGRVNAFRAVSFAGASEGYGATYDTHAVPRAVEAGTTFTASVRVTNDTATVWRAGGRAAVRLSYHWIDQQGTTRVWDGARAVLGADVAAGETATVAVRVRAPSDAASYALRFDLVRDGVAWYSERGVAPADVAVSVDQGLSASYAPKLGTTAITNGTPLLLPVMLTNTGTRAWPAAGPAPVRLAYHWVRPDGSVVIWDGTRAASFASDIAPGASVNARLLIAPPAARGAFVLRIDLVEEGVAWFSDRGIGTDDVGFVID